MTGHETRRYDMLTRVRSFGDTYRRRFPDTSSAHEAFTSLAEEIGRLEALEVSERLASEGARADKRHAARAVFCNLLTRAGATARVLGRTHPLLQVRIPSRLPKDDLQLLTLARQVAAGVTGYGAEFDARGIPLATLDAGIAAFEAALAHRGDSRDDRVKARAERQAAFARAMHAVATLDVTVANGIVDPVVLAVWKHGRRMPSRRRSAAAAVEAPTAETAAAEIPAMTSLMPLTALPVGDGDAVIA